MTCEEKGLDLDLDISISTCDTSGVFSPAARDGISHCPEKARNDSEITLSKSRVVIVSKFLSFF